MNLDDLKQTWIDEMNTFSVAESISFEQVRRQADKLDKKSAKSVSTEICTCVVVFLGISFFSIFLPKLNLALQFSFTLSALMCFYIPYRLLKARKVSKEDNWTLRSRINSEIAKLEKQSELMNSVGQWYLLPTFIAVFSGLWGGYTLRTQTLAPDAQLLIYWGLAIILYIGIFLYNRRAVKTNIQPVLDRLRKIRAQLSEVTAEEK